MLPPFSPCLSLPFSHRPLFVPLALLFFFVCPPPHGPSDASGGHHAAVTASAGAITEHAHYGKHNMYLFVCSIWPVSMRPLLVQPKKKSPLMSPFCSPPLPTPPSIFLCLSLPRAPPWPCRWVTSRCRLCRRRGLRRRRPRPRARPCRSCSKSSPTRARSSRFR